MRFLVIGQSHLHALRAGFATMKGDVDPRAHAFEFVQLRGSKAIPANLGKDELSDAQGNPIVPGAADMVVSCVAGNHHNVFGLLNHIERFDFVLPGEPDVSIDPSAEVLPVGLVLSALAAQMTGVDKLLRNIKALTAKPVFHLEPPPPNPSAEHIETYPRHFRSRIAELGVAPATLRYKLWRLHSFILRQFTARNGIAFVPAPVEMQDSRGMLIKSAWSNDPTHGNACYGRAVLCQLTALAETDAPRAIAP